MRLPLNTGRACVENRGSHPYMVGSQNGRLPRAVEAHPPQPASKSKKIGARHGVLGACVFGVINAGNVKNGIGVPERRVLWSRRGHDKVTTGSRRGHDAVTTGSRQGHDRVTTRSRCGRDAFCGHDTVTVTTRSRCSRDAFCGHDVVTTGPRQGHDAVTVTTRSRGGHDAFCGHDSGHDRVATRSSETQSPQSQLRARILRFHSRRISQKNHANK